MNREVTQYSWMLDRSFEEDETGQLYYAPPRTAKLPVEVSDYNDAVRRLETGMLLTKVIGGVTAAICIAALFTLGLRNELELEDGLLIIVPIVVYFAAVAWFSYASVRPLERRRMLADGTATLPTRTKWASRAFGAVVGAVVIYYIIRANL